MKLIFIILVSLLLCSCAGNFYEIKNFCKLCDRCGYAIKDSKTYWKNGRRLYQFCDGCISRTNIRNGGKNGNQSDSAHNGSCSARTYDSNFNLLEGMIIAFVVGLALFICIVDLFNNKIGRKKCLAWLRKERYLKKQKNCY